ncbi:MAG: transcription-repair coupling factor, partial [Alphaproteobacteria bacterium]|nr:transcription-repair coupling factor [Alphaproteobacteria bacterium]
MESPATKEAFLLRQLAGVPRSSQPLVLAELLAGKFAAPNAKKLDTLVHVCVGDRAMESLAAALTFFAPDVEVLHLPAWDCLPYDRASPQAAIMAERMRTLSALAAGANDKPRIILTTANALLQRLPPRAAMRQVFFTLEKGKKLERDALIAYLVAQGYRRVGKAMEAGEFALRGGIIDIIPSGMSEGMRVDLFGDDIESIRSFDPLSQITEKDVEGFTLYPISEVLLSAQAIERFREQYREIFGANTRDDPLYEAISHGQSYVGMEHWLPLFYERTETLFDYCASALVTLDSEVEKAIAERQETILDYYGARKEALKSASAKNSFASSEVYHPTPPDTAFIMPESWKLLAQRADPLLLSPFTPEGIAPRFDVAAYRQVLRFTQGQADRTPFDQLSLQVESAATRGKKTLLGCFSEGSRERLFTLLMERGFHVLRIENWNELKDVRGKTVGLCVLPLESGFETDGVLLFSEQDMLGERIVRAVKKKKSDVFLQEAANFQEGELVVHKEHGIGRF